MRLPSARCRRTGPAAHPQRSHAPLQSPPHARQVPFSTLLVKPLAATAFRRPHRGPPKPRPQTPSGPTATSVSAVTGGGPGTLVLAASRTPRSSTPRTRSGARPPENLHAQAVKNLFRSISQATADRACRPRGQANSGCKSFSTLGLLRPLSIPPSNSQECQKHPTSQYNRNPSKQAKPPPTSSPMRPVGHRTTGITGARRTRTTERRNNRGKSLDDVEHPIPALLIPPRRPNISSRSRKAMNNFLSRKPRKLSPHQRRSPRNDRSRR
jgi:hypothetical protein